MAQPRYRAIIKVLCEECQLKVSTNKRIDVKCRSCSFKKYNNVNNLLTFTVFLNKEFPNWVWFNVYDYVKGENGGLLQSFQRGKNEPTTRSL
jgi:hypothetical protein